MNIKPGLRGVSKVVVEHGNTAAAIGSGTIEVFATPFMVALMENAALVAVQPFLDDGEATVGASINVSHDVPTPIGATVTAEAELIEVDRRKLVFRVVARSGSDIIGQGSHVRFVISEKRFMEKVAEKKNSLN